MKEPDPVTGPLKIRLQESEIMVGLEVHRQLKGPKLFCRCDTELRDHITSRIERVLYPKLSEMGSLDQAALSQSKRKRRIVYELTENVCPVDIDEEPPIGPLPSTLDLGLIVCLLFGCDLVDHVQFMRKIVIDGSNPAGFQRTALIGLDGGVNIGSERMVPIGTICLEEDAGRKICAEGDYVTYRLDRLGTSEIEISTSPFISSPDEAYMVAKRIGDILRSTNGVKRGIGSVRQDVNISIRGGSRVEIKLVQDLSLIPKIVRYEAMRHSLCIWIAQHLNKTGTSKKGFSKNISDLTSFFDNTECGIIRSSIERGGGVYGVNLPGFKGLLSPFMMELQIKNDDNGTVEDITGVVSGLGREIALRIRHETGLNGVIHSDELPAYGIDPDEILRVKNALGTDPQRDAFVIVTADASKAETALCMAVERAIMSFEGVVPEVRRVLQDGTTEYLRPLPGPARMYPETDIPLIRLENDRIERLMSALPEDPEVRRSRLCMKTGLSSTSLEQITGLGMLNIFEELSSSEVDPRTLSMIILNGLGPVIDGREGEIDLSSDLLSIVVEAVNDGALAREAVPGIFQRIGDMIGCMDEGAMIELIMEEYGIKDDDMIELDLIIDDIIREKRDLILERGERSLSPLMGLIMKKMRGRISGSIVEKRLRERIGITSLYEGKV